MALALCKECGARRLMLYPYTGIPVKPIGYPETSTICSKGPCERPALLWLNRDEEHNLGSGQRIFKAAKSGAKIKVDERSLG